MKKIFIKKFRKIAFWLAISFATAILIICIFILSVRQGFFGPLPTYSQLAKIQQNNGSKILSAEGSLLGLYYYENRTNVKIEVIPETFIEALISTEDARFYKHNGFDVRSFFRVLFKSILLFDKSSGGGSTISQQLSKNLFDRQNLNLFSLPVAKIKEIITAMRLEKIYSKDEILELYLNTVPFGENTYGIETASITYFGKNPGDLNIQESAVLVGLLKANTGYNPRVNKEAALNRRNIVLNQMVKAGYLSSEKGDSLKSLPIELHFTKLDHIDGPAPYFREFLRFEAKAILDNYNAQNDTNINLYSDGLTIYTTINSKLQSFAEDAVKSQMSLLQKKLEKQWRRKAPWETNPEVAQMQIRQSVPMKKFRAKGMTENEAMEAMKIPHITKIFTWKGEVDTLMSSLDSILYHFGILQCGVFAIDGKSGDVLAWVGGANYKYFKYDHVLASRQVGSTIKPLIYATALDHGISPCDYFENDSVSYPEADDWVPQNADHSFGGYYSVQGALVHSVNTVSVKILMETGIDRTILSLMDLGITAPLPKVPSLALGSAEIPLHQMVPAYANFINEGKVPTIQYIDKIVDRNGNLIYEKQKEIPKDEVFSERTVCEILALLKGVTERGTAASLRTSYGLKGDFGGKTGTTQNQTDGWFIGISPDIVIGVWVGGDNPVVHFKNLSEGQGSRTAMPIFATLMKEIKADQTTESLISGSFSIPQEIYDQIGCFDFKEDKSPFDFFRKKPAYRDLPNTRNKKESKKVEKVDSKVSKFFKNIFGTGKKKK